MTYNTTIMRKNLNPQTQGVPYMSRVFAAVMQWNRTDADLTRLASLYKVDSLDILHGYDDARGQD